MEKEPIKLDLIKLLIADRNHHFSHPHEVSIKLYYSIGGTVTTLLIALFIKNLDGSKSLVGFVAEGSNQPYFIFFAFCVIIGYLLIFWGLGEHSALHASQREKIEKAIKFLLETKQY